MLREGDKAPEFTAVDQNGTTVSLKDFRGKKLVLYFYSEAGSPTCTLESCNLRDHYAELNQAGLEVLGVSPDKVAMQKKFETKYNLPFRLIADEDHQLVRLYGVWGHKKLFGREYMGVLRTTFVIDENGIIMRIVTKPRNKDHARQILELMG